MAAEPPERPKIGMRIRLAMERLRMDQKQLADALGKSRGAVNNWINDKAYPQNSIGALEEILQVDLHSPEIDDLFWLPEDLRPYRHDPIVMDALNIRDLTVASKISVMRHALKERESTPEIVTRNAGIPGVLANWNEYGLSIDDRLALVSLALELARQRGEDVAG